MSRVGHIECRILFPQLRFMCSGELLFTGTINERIVGYLDGYAIPYVDPKAYALLAKPPSTLPFDLSLWHSRCGHLHHDAVALMSTLVRLQTLYVSHASLASCTEVLYLALPRALLVPWLSFTLIYMRWLS